MESSDSNNKDSHSYFSEYVFLSCAKKFETHHNEHIIYLLMSSII